MNEETELRTTAPKVWDVIAAMQTGVATALPVGTIMEMEDNPKVATVIYKVAEDTWTATGFMTPLTNQELADFTNASPAEWLIVRLGHTL